MAPSIGQIMAAQSDLFIVGDMITINGMYADGTREANETPPAEYANKPLQNWRVVYVGPEGVKLHIVTGDAQRDAFNNMFGEYWIRADGSFT